MYTDKKESELARLRLEDYIWLFYSCIIIANIYGTYYEKQYVKTDNKACEEKADHIFETILILVLLIYLYFFTRNYKSYQNAPEEERQVYLVRVFGSAFIITGVLCLIYFQHNHSSFTGSTTL